MSSREEVSAKYLTDYRSTTTEVDIYCYVAARTEWERPMELQYPRVLFTRGREGRDGWLPGEASNLIVASCLTITDTGFS